MDLGIEVIIDLFSKEGLAQLFIHAEAKGTVKTDNATRIFALRAAYERHIHEVVAFLQGKNQSYARQICSEGFLPQASRFEQVEDLEWAFGNMGIQDKAKHLGTLFLEDLSDFIQECLDPHFGFSRYAERLGMSANSFDALHKELEGEPSYIDRISIKLLAEKMREFKPKLVCFSVPFPGNLYSAFRAAQFIKKTYPEVKVAMGGGFPNTELRSISDSRVFDFFDFISLDDGELPIELLVNHVKDAKGSPLELKRTFLCENGEVNYCNSSSTSDYKQSEIGCPDYSDLRLQEYLSVIELTNPMHSLWTDGRWLKLTMAHGCYWGKCTFCDISLDYIKLYEPIAAATLVDRMEMMIAQTGERGFHFVDEAAPPALMRALALEILKRNLSVTWWTNIRFEKSFTRDLCSLLKASGCIAVSGGLEVASDRLLKLIDKGVTVAQVAQVTRNFSEAGILVHAYLMYGYPSQTIQETIDSLEMVRQLFEMGVIQSGFWHQFALTAHSPVGLDPETYGVLPERMKIDFAENDIAFKDKTGIDHDQFSFGLKKSLLNYMHGIGFEYPLQFWFDQDIPKTSIKKNHIASSLGEEHLLKPSMHSKIIWIGTLPLVEEVEKRKKTNSTKHLALTFHSERDEFTMHMDIDKGKWLIAALDSIRPANKNLKTLGMIRDSFQEHFKDFDSFWNSGDLQELRNSGLLLI